jgi:hypothetical protein
VAEEEKGQFCQDDHCDWLVIGEDPHFDQLHAWCKDSDPQVNWCQSNNEVGDMDMMGQEDVLQLTVGQGEERC